MKWQHANKGVGHVKRVKYVTHRIHRMYTRHTRHTALSMLLILVLCFFSLGMALPPDGDSSKQEDSDIIGLDAGVRVPPDIQPMSFTGGAMMLTGVTAGDLQTMVEDDLVANAGQTAGSYDYTVITSLTISGALDAADTDFIKRNLTNLATLDMGGVTTTAFSNATFRDCTSLVSVTLPVGCAVSGYMFYGCKNLTTVNNLDKATLLGQSVFYDCSSLVSVTLPIGCAVSDHMFRECTALTTVNNLDKAVSVGSTAFGICTALRSVTISSGFAGTGAMAFFACQNLEITLLYPGVVSVDASGSGTFVYAR